MSPKFLFTLLGIFALLIYSGEDSVQDAIGFVPALYAAGLMSLMGGLGGAISLLVKKPSLSFRSVPWWVFLAYLLYFGGIELALYYSVKVAGPEQTVLFGALSTVIVVIFGRVFLKHAVDHKHFLGVIICIAGVFLGMLSKTNLSAMNFSVLIIVFPLLAALLDAIYTTTSNYFDNDCRAIIVTSYFVGSFILLSTAYFFETWHPLTLQMWLIVIVGGVCMNFVADVSWDFSLKRGNFYLLNSAANFLPLVAIALMVCIGQTKFSWYLVLAAALVVIGCALPEIGKQENAKEE